MGDEDISSRTGPHLSVGQLGPALQEHMSPKGSEKIEKKPDTGSQEMSWKIKNFKTLKVS